MHCGSDEASGGIARVLQDGEGPKHPRDRWGGCKRSMGALRKAYMGLIFGKQSWLACDKPSYNHMIELGLLQKRLFKARVVCDMLT